MVDADILFVKQVEEKIRQSNTVMYRHGRSILTGMGVSTPQFNALLTLQEFGSLTMGELCKHLFTACSTATDLADRMERAGLVERVRDTNDRRVVRMNLLPKGEEIVDAVISERCQFLREVLQEYPEEEQPKVLQFLQVLAERMESVDARGEVSS
ncbi:MarR-type HTH domain protein [Acididesulfobacillus acetoxydans]|uniref:MarR-type HTH domain protein n=1 Tax=Acididesulfobacillus acetoxydans TaxID=1561005 RepID=A0A8S0VVH8_9FIRM|nr:MarR family transcriptional regulator [Acididesulfobacillus acetoxydans]CAA7599513.1 MarR-type HTH domain protein [Acididesulfobacillus acetoxydans]CEJ08682.1 Transcriptional regulator, MarR [Acididesulfobacillus acetoxydans]